MTTLSSYLSITSNISRWLTATAQSPAVSVATKYFEDNICKVKSANDLVSNPRLFDYAMTAFGLGDMTYAQGLMKQVLAQGVSSSNALANTLPNPNIQAFARAFDFVDNGSSTRTPPSLVEDVINRYLENSLQTTQGHQDPGPQRCFYACLSQELRLPRNKRRHSHRVHALLPNPSDRQASLCSRG
jgi:Protein of unknown function (DUF1217)